MYNISYNSIKKYFDKLSVLGYTSYEDVYKLLFMFGITDFIYKDFSALITKDDYRDIEKALYNVFGTSSIISFPSFNKMGTNKLHVGSITELVKKISNNNTELLIEDIESKIETKASSILNSVNTEINNVKTTIINNRQELQQSIDNTTSVANNNQSAITTAQQQIANVNNSIQSINDSIGGLNGSLSTINDTVSDINESINDINDIIDNIGEGGSVDDTHITSIANTVANDAIARVVDGAPESFNTLKEIATWISSDNERTANLVTEINNINSSITSINNSLSGVVNDVAGLSADNDSINNTLTTINNTIANMPGSSDIPDLSDLNNKVSTLENKFDSSGVLKRAHIPFGTLVKGGLHVSNMNNENDINSSIYNYFHHTGTVPSCNIGDLLIVYGPGIRTNSSITDMIIKLYQLQSNGTWTVYLSLDIDETFTTDQWKAINSGITSEIIGAIQGKLDEIDETGFVTVETE